MIAVAGEALVDLVADRDSRTFVAYPGGSPANVAVGLARLGVPVAMFGRLAGDVFGRLLRDHLRDNGVDLDQAVVAAEPSSLAVATLDNAGGATYDFWVNGTADWQWNDTELPDRLSSDFLALHTGSLAAALGPGAAVLERLLERLRDVVTITFDPNLRPGLMGDPETTRERVRRQVRLAEVVKVSDEDLRWINPSQSYVEVAREWLSDGSEDGPAMVIVTLGALGAYAATRRVEIEHPVPAVPLVDTVGAGDAFTAGLLAGMEARAILGPGSGQRIDTLDTAVLTVLLREATVAAGVTCSRAGADPPTREELDRAIR